MIALPVLSVLAAVTFWGVFSPHDAGLVFVGLVLMFTAWQFLGNIALRPKNLEPGAQPYRFTQAEIDVFRRHALYFRHPYMAKQASSTFSAIQMLSIVWMMLLLWNELWWLAGAAAVLFAISSNMAPHINPGHFLRYHHARGKLTSELEEKLALVQSVEDKLSSAAA